MAQESTAIDLSNAPRFDEVVDEVQRTRRTRVISRADAPVAIITPVQLRPGDPSAKQRLFRIIDEVHERTKDMDPNEIEADIAAAVAEVRQERHGE